MFIENSITMKREQFNRLLFGLILLLSCASLPIHAQSNATRSDAGRDIKKSFYSVNGGISVGGEDRHTLPMLNVNLCNLNISSTSGWGGSLVVGVDAFPFDGWYPLHFLPQISVGPSYTKTFPERRWAITTRLTGGVIIVDAESPTLPVGIGGGILWRFKADKKWQFVAGADVSYFFESLCIFHPTIGVAYAW